MLYKKIIEVPDKTEDEVCGNCVFLIEDGCLIELVEDYFNVNIDSACNLRDITYQITEKD